MEKPGLLQSTGSQRERRNLATEQLQQQATKIVIGKLIFVKEEET